MPGLKETLLSKVQPEIDGLTLIDRDVTLVGEIVSEENIRLRGRVEGSVVTSGSVVIEPQGSVRGDITAENLIVEGSVEGRVVVARKFELRPTRSEERRVGKEC